MVTKNLEASTAHITKEDAALLDVAASCPGVPPVVVYKYPEGYFVHVPAGAEDFKDAVLTADGTGFSQNLIDLMGCARQNKCKYVQLDRDGETYPDIPTYEW